jgi:hypothetical protein
MDDDDDDDDASVTAAEEAEADALAIIVIPAPAALVVDPATRPGAVSVAESIDAVLLELVEAVSCAAGAGSPPAEIVTGPPTTVCIVL